MTWNAINWHEFDMNLHEWHELTWHYKICRDWLHSPDLAMKAEVTVGAPTCLPRMKKKWSKLDSSRKDLTKLDLSRNQTRFA
jgi:hypothetical protein